MIRRLAHFEVQFRAADRARLRAQPSLSVSFGQPLASRTDISTGARLARTRVFQWLSLSPATLSDNADRAEEQQKMLRTPNGAPNLSPGFASRPKGATQNSAALPAASAPTPRPGRWPGTFAGSPRQPQSKLKRARRVLRVLCAQNTVSSRQRKTRIVENLEEVGIKP
jgi:hypothetical protein